MFKVLSSGLLFKVRCSMFVFKFCCVLCKSLISLLNGYLHDVLSLHGVTVFTRKTQILLTAMVSEHQTVCNFAY